MHFKSRVPVKGYCQSAALAWKKPGAKTTEVGNLCMVHSKLFVSLAGQTLMIGGQLFTEGTHSG